MHLACIVEGHGEVQAVPVLLRRLASALDPTLTLQVEQPIRITKSKLLQAGELERAVELAARKVGRAGGILILLDSDEDCPATLGPALLSRACAVRRNVPISVVLAKHEFEAWFLAAADSLAGCRGLRNDLQAPAQPEHVRGAKEWLTDRMTEGHRYVETLDQPALTAVFDLAAARRADSFDLPDALVTVVSVQWFGSEALELTYKTATGRVANELLYRHDEVRLEVVEHGRPWSFDGDGARFRLVSEAQRIRLAHLFDPMLAVHTSVVEPLPHQITAVYETMLPRQPCASCWPMIPARARRSWPAS